MEVPEDPNAALGREAMDNLIDRTLVYQESQKKGTRVHPYLVERTVQMYRDRFPDEASYRQTLQRFMYTPESFRQYVERGLIIEKYRDEEIVSSVVVTEEEIWRIYEENVRNFLQVAGQVHARHILIEVPLGVSEAEKDEALQRIQQIRQRIVCGESFEDLARVFSQDPASAVNGGDLGFIHRGQMTPDFDEAAFRLQPGQLSDVVETEFGYHLIEVIGRKEEGIVSFADAHFAIAESLRQARTDKVVDLFLARLRAAAEIEILLPIEGDFGEPWSEERTQTTTEG
jgi:peptidyl-prolyl cis-trans isomerase C